MMAIEGGIPVYESDQRVPDGPQPGLQTVDAPVADYSGIGKAVERFGMAESAYQVHLQNAQQLTQDDAIKTDYLTKVDALRNKYTRSKDFANAPKQFGDDLQGVQQDLLGQVQDPRRREQLRLYMTTHGLTVARDVHQTALTNEADFNVANLNTRSIDYIGRAAGSQSSAEFNTVVGEMNSDIDKQAAAGWITKTDAARRKITAGQTLDDASAMSLIRANPKAAIQELQDPEKFKWLGPVKREALLNEAKAQADQVATLTVQNIAQRDPVRAVAMTGLVGGVTEADGVFDRGIIPIESGGNTKAVSSAGALGAAQVMPESARTEARRLGLNDIASLPDDQLKDRLLNDPKLNRQLGLSEWRSLIARYDGKIYAAAAAYNAGPGNANKPRADAWVAEATAKFGPNYTAAELASVIPIKETHDYVLKLSKQLGADPGGLGMSASGNYHAANAVSAVLNQNETERQAAIKAVAAVSRETDDPAEVFKAGYGFDPARYASWKQAQMDAAAGGDMTAAKAVRTAEFQREMLPFRQEALRTPPAQLEAFVSREDARLRAGGIADMTDAKNRLDVARETFKSVVEARKENPVGLAEQAGLVPPAARVQIDPRADFRSQDFSGALAARGAQANAAAKFYLGSALALKPQELAAMKERWENAGPDDKFGMISAFGKSLNGQAYDETVAAVIGKKDPGAVVAGRIAATRPEIAHDILQGSELLKSKEVQEKAQLVVPAFQSKLGGQIYPDPVQQKAVEQAAIALYVSRAGANGTLYDPADTTGIEKAIEDVTGPIVKRNGVKTPIAPGLDRGRFLGALDHLTDADVTAMGGARDRTGRAVPASEITDYAVLKPLAPGATRYVVGMRDPRSPDGFAPLFTDGETPSPLVFDMRALSTRAPAGSASPAIGKTRAGMAAVRASLGAELQATRREVGQ